MRKIPYTERLYHHPSNKSSEPRSKFSSAFNNNSFKVDRTKLNDPNESANMMIGSSKNYGLQQGTFTMNRHSHQPKTVISSGRRPITTNKMNSFSELKKDINQSIHEYDRNKSDLWVSTLKDAGRYSSSKRNNGRQSDSHNKGKVYKGTSWRNEDINENSLINQSKLKSYKIQSNETKYQKKQNSNIISKNNRPSGIFDLLGKNLKKTDLSSIHKNNNHNNNYNNSQLFQYIMRFSYRTRKGYIPNNHSKVNQDSYIITPNINNKTWQHFFSVCDGHGPLGHYVSNFIKNNFPNYLCNCKNLSKNPKQILPKIFQQTYQKLIKQSHIDLAFSGSTIIGCYILHNKLYSCNVGDSRAIIGRFHQEKWSAIALSTDHKPSLTKEASRIIKMKGRIEAYKDQYGEQIGPLRVWVQNQNIPGLAMTRSFGDLVGASVGVSPIPQIKQFTLTHNERIILIGSDGVFEFLSNEEIINILSPYYQKKQIQQASDELLNLAYRSWGKNSSIIDDITFILIFINFNE